MSTSPTSSTNVATSITSVVVRGVVLIVTAILIIKCVKKKKVRSISNPVQITSGVIATIPLTSAVSLASEFEGASIEIFLNEFEGASIERFFNEIAKEKPIRFTPQHLIDFTSNYSERLGSGGFGVVYKGQFPNGVQVAVKVLNRSLDKRVKEQFMAEVGTIGRTYHINLVRLYGFCFNATVKALVYEYMENGSLDRYLFDDKQRIGWGKLHEITIGTAKGLRYLHEECQQRIIHYDIKPGNVLLGADFSPKVADFGLAKLCDRENSHVTMTGCRGTPGYAAPELWMPFPVTQGCDVYSFGMLLFEILGRRRNLDVKEANSSQEWFPRWVWEKFEEGELRSVISKCGIEEEEREKAERMCQVALWCVQFQPGARHSMSSVVRMLEGEVEIVAPVNPFQHLAQSNGVSGLYSGSTTDSTSRGTTKHESGR